MIWENLEYGRVGRAFRMLLSCSFSLVIILIDIALITAVNGWVHRLSAVTLSSFAPYLCRTVSHATACTPHRRNHLEFATSGGAMAVLGFNILTTVVVIQACCIVIVLSRTHESDAHS